MAATKQREAAERSVNNAQTGAQREQTLKHVSPHSRSGLGSEAAAVRRGDAPSRKELCDEARELDLEGRSKIGKADLERAIARATD